VRYIFTIPNLVGTIYILMVLLKSKSNGAGTQEKTRLKMQLEKRDPTCFSHGCNHPWTEALKLAQRGT